jgi:hypothetical protein
MGIDFLDIQQRCEAEFGVNLDFGRLPGITPDHPRLDVTAGELHEYICRQIEATQRQVPAASWERFQAIVVSVLFVDISAVTHEARMIQDLGME